MNLIDTAKTIAENEGVEFQTRCSFCNGLEEACGDLGVEIAPGQFMELPIGENCLAAAKKANARWVDNPHTATSEPVR